MPSKLGTVLAIYLSMTTQVPKTISSTELQAKFGTSVEWVLSNKAELVVESRGVPTIVIVPYVQYEQTKQLQAELRRRQALAKLERLREKVSARFRDLTEEQRAELANRFSREFVQDLVAEGKVRFQ
jgi:prevent-host-death family protein